VSVAAQSVVRHWVAVTGILFRDRDVEVDWTLRKTAETDSYESKCLVAECGGGNGRGSAQRRGAQKVYWGASLKSPDKVG